MWHRRAFQVISKTPKKTFNSRLSGLFESGQVRLSLQTGIINFAKTYKFAENKPFRNRTGYFYTNACHLV